MVALHLIIKMQMEKMFIKKEVNILFPPYTVVIAQNAKNYSLFMRHRGCFNDIRRVSELLVAGSSGGCWNRIKSSNKEKTGGREK